MRAVPEVPDACAMPRASMFSRRTTSSNQSPTRRHRRLRSVDLGLQSGSGDGLVQAFAAGMALQGCSEDGFPALGIRSSSTTRSMLRLPTTAIRLCIYAILPRVTGVRAALGVD